MATKTPFVKFGANPHNGESPGEGGTTGPSMHEHHTCRYFCLTLALLRRYALENASAEDEASIGRHWSFACPCILVTHVRIPIPINHTQTAKGSELYHPGAPRPSNHRPQIWPHRDVRRGTSYCICRPSPSGLAPAWTPWPIQGSRFKPALGGLFAIPHCDTTRSTRTCKRYAHLHMIAQCAPSRRPS